MFNKMVIPTGGGGDNRPETLTETFNASVNPKTFHTREATLCQTSGYGDFCVINGKFTSLRNTYPTLLLVSYDEPTNILTISWTSGTNYEYKIVYEPLD